MILLSALWILAWMGLSGFTKGMTVAKPRQ